MFSLFLKATYLSLFSELGLFMNFLYNFSFVLQDLANPAVTQGLRGAHLRFKRNLRIGKESSKIEENFGNYYSTKLIFKNLC